MKMLGTKTASRVYDEILMELYKGRTNKETFNKLKAYVGILNEEISPVDNATIPKQQSFAQLWAIISLTNYFKDVTPIEGRMHSYLVNHYKGFLKVKLNSNGLNNGLFAIDNALVLRAKGKSRKGYGLDEDSPIKDLDYPYALTVFKNGNAKAVNRMLEDFANAPSDVEMIKYLLQMLVDNKLAVFNVSIHDKVKEILCSYPSKEIDWFIKGGFFGDKLKDKKVSILEEILLTKVTQDVALSRGQDDSLLNKKTLGHKL